MVAFFRIWMYRSGLSMIVLSIAFCCPMKAANAQVSEARDQELKTRIAGLLRELDANQRVRRINAERELLDYGPAILNDLPAPDLIANPAVRTSVAKIRKTLELRKANESVRPTLVKTAAGISLGAFLQEVKLQTTNEIDTSKLKPDDLSSPVLQACQGIPFWQALETTTTHLGVRGDFRPDAPALLLQSGVLATSPPELAVAMSGPFRVALESLKPRAIAGSTQRRLRAEFSVTPEPRLRALFLKFQSRDFFALTQDGKTLSAADPDAQLDLPLGEGGHHVRWNLDFLVPAGVPNGELAGARVTGVATMQVAAGAEHIRIRDLTRAQGVSRRRGGVTVSVLKVEAREIADSKRDISVQIQVAYDTGGPAFESHRTWIFHNQVYLEPLEGDRIPVDGGYDTDLQANGVVGVTYRFKSVTSPLDQLQFVYEAPTLIIDVPVSLELQPGHFLGGEPMPE